MVPKDYVRCLVYIAMSVTHAVTGVNIALGKPTSQSSVALGAISARAVDGNTDGNFGAGSCIHTYGGNQWWLVDLQGYYNVTRVFVKNRSDMDGYFFVDFVVEVFSQNPMYCGDATKVTCFSHPGEAALGEMVDMPCTVEALGRYLRVRKRNTEHVLIICEVEVEGYPACKAVPGHYYTRHQGKKTSTDRAVVPGKTILECVSLCYHSNSCHGINHHPGTGECQASQFAAETGLTDLPSDSNGWDHYSIC